MKVFYIPKGTKGIVFNVSTISDSDGVFFSVIRTMRPNGKHSM